MDIEHYRLREVAHLRWGENLSPHFDPLFERVLRAIESLPDDFEFGGPWPPTPLPPPVVPRLPVPSARAGADPTDAGVAALAQAIAAGVFTAREVVDAFLARSERLDPTLRVWATLDPENARLQAGRCDDGFRVGDPPHLLSGVPIGVKDIFSTDDLPTHANSKVRPLFVVPEDAIAVSCLRVEGGAVILGKTATTEYAYSDPAETRNPWNTAHTPGGSSSGSAAGVAARMMPAALGTQTAGSVLRPAAYCGIVGFKPTTERISRLDVAPLARSLDHVGTLTRSVADAARLYRVMTNAAESFDPLGFHGTGIGPWRFALWPDFLQRYTDEQTRAALRTAASILERAGAEITLVTDEVHFNQNTRFGEDLLSTHTVIMAAEVAAYHLAAHPDRIDDLGPRLRAMIQVGSLVPARALLIAQAQRSWLWHHWHQYSEARHYDAVIVPAAPGTAPEGLDSTGDASLNAPWTLLGVPAITIPIALAENGLPLGMQLVAPYGEDARLLAIADWCEKVIGFDARPEL